MVDLEFRYPTEQDILWITEHLTEADRVELFAGGHKSVEKVIRDAVRKSKACIVAVYEDKPLTIYGLYKSSVLGNGGIPWMLTTHQSKQYRREYMVYTRLVIDEMLEECDVLSNYVHAKNRISIKWLKALGFTIDEPEENPITKELFHRFHLSKRI